ncbi:hypothetical protein S83_063226, partial [Arachis hypogaea]
TTALMLAFSEHLRDNYSLATDNSSLLEKVVPSGGRAVHCCDNSLFLKQNHISRGITFSREAKMLWDLNWVKDGLMWKITPITLIFLAAMMPCLDPLGVLSFGWNFGNTPVIFGSAILGFLIQWFGALALGWPKGHATKLTSFQESNSEIQTSCSDIAKSTMDITKKRKPKSLHGKANKRQSPDRRIFLPEGLLYDLREGGLRGLEEGGTAKEIEF